VKNIKDPIIFNSNNTDFVVTKSLPVIDCGKCKYHFSLIRFDQEIGDFPGRPYYTNQYVEEFVEFCPNCGKKIKIIKSG
jgi:hypothetical protein